MFVKRSTRLPGKTPEYSGVLYQETDQSQKSFVSKTFKKLYNISCLTPSSNIDRFQNILACLTCK